MGEWIRFALTAVLLIWSLVSFTAAVIGAYRFGFVLNRMHAAGIGDTLGLFGVVAALVVSGGLNMDSLKLILIIVFLWFTSPVTSHFLSQIEYYTNPNLYLFTDRRAPGEGAGPGKADASRSMADAAGNQADTARKAADADPETEEAVE